MRPVPIEVTSAPTKLERTNITRAGGDAGEGQDRGPMPLKPFLPKAMPTMMNGMMSTPNMWKRPTIAELSATVR